MTRSEAVAQSQAAEIITADAHIDQHELSLNARRAATAIEALGIQEGDVVAMLLRNDIPFIEAGLATQYCGVYAVPINWHSAPDEILYVLKDCGARLLIAHADLYRTIEKIVPAHCKVIVVPTPASIRDAFGLTQAQCDVPDGMPEWLPWLSEFEPWSKPDKPVHGSIIYTSGTTGKPKGVKRDPMTPEIRRRNFELFKQTYGIATDVRALIVTPLYHAAPNAFARYVATTAELVVLTPRFDAEEFLALVEKYRINTVTAVPTIFVKLLKLPEEVRNKYDISSLRWISHTAAACPVEVKRGIIEWMGPILHELYGGTEVGIGMHCDSHDWLKRPGTVGKSIAGSTIRIYNEDGTEAPVGVPGEIYVHSPAYSDFTYINMPEQRAEVERDGLISIGDVGYLDDAGFLYISDRKRDMIIYGGTNIYPAEIESALIQNEGVADCAVIGLPDPDFGETVAAFVKKAPGADLSEEDVRTFLGGRIAKYKIPHTIKFVDSLPREESGKLMKRKLRDEYRPG
ncbi:MAG: AMP-binding protein [Rhodobiaceae bacterium]|nr:AMP-binding protein [Rhodobiaceae bacterium]MCC0056196.1 AMP-binding protein [Rhodobiaceae bacterium]